MGKIKFDGSKADREEFERGAGSKANGDYNPKHAVNTSIFSARHVYDTAMAQKQRENRRKERYY